MSTLNPTEPRSTFNGEAAAALAAQVGVSPRWTGQGSAHFAYFADGSRFAVVAGSQEGKEVDLAFAYGLTYRGDRQLILVLPERYAFSTIQRAPWFANDSRPELWVHDEKTARRVRLPSKTDTKAALSKRLNQTENLEQELRAAATATHLGVRTDDVFELVEWATKRRELAPAHRKGERAWHYMGQKVLSIRGTAGGLSVRAGIHFSADSEPSAAVPKGKALAGETLERIKALVESGITARRAGEFKKPDEHWLQALIMRDPTLVGVEPAALRELPAWRPQCALPVPDSASLSARRAQWGRGFIDLVGIDGHGHLRVIETKLADNRDARLIFQGLDYYIWASAYQDVIRNRLGAPGRSQIHLHYVIGDTTAGRVHVSDFAMAQAAGLDKEIPWRFQTVRNWFHPDGDTRQTRSELLSPRTLPS